MRNSELGKLIENRYIVEKILAQDELGDIVQIWHLDWERSLYAKRIKISSQNRDRLLEEGQTWVNLGIHPNIIGAHFISQVQDNLYLFLERDKGQRLSQISPGEASPYSSQFIETALQIAYGLQHLHEERIVHGNIRPDNILLNKKGQVKVSNIRWASWEGVENATKGLRNPFLVQEQNSRELDPRILLAYFPPEHFTRKSNQKPLSFANDVYGFGVLLYYLFTTKLPFYDDKSEVKNLFSSYTRLHNEVAIPPLREIAPSASPALCELVTQCLEKDPSLRPSFSSILKNLQSIYKAENQAPYIFEELEETELISISLNNQALGKIDEGDYERAEEFLQEVALLHNQRVGAILNLNLLRLKSSRITVSQYLDKTRCIKSIDPLLVLHTQSLVCLEYGSLIQDVLEEWKKVPLADKNEEILMLEAKLYYRLERYQEAMDQLNNLAKQGYDGADLWYLLGAACFALDHHKEAQQAWETGLQKQLPLVDLLIAYGMLLAVKGEWAKARSYFDEGIRNTQNYAHSRKITSTWSHIYTDIAKPEAEEEDEEKAKQGVLLHQLQKEKKTTVLAISANGRKAASCGSDKIIQVWNLREGTSIAHLSQDTDRINSIAISDDGLIVVAGGWDKKLFAWDVLSKTCIATLEGHEEDITAISLSPDGKIAASGDRSGHIFIWSIPDKKQTASLEGHKSAIKNLSLATDQSRIVAKSCDGKIRIYENTSQRACPCWVRAPYLLEELSQPKPLEECQKLQVIKEKAQAYAAENNILQSLHEWQKIRDLSSGQGYFSATEHIITLAQSQKLSLSKLKRAIEKSIFLHKSKVYDFVVTSTNSFFSATEDSIYRWQIQEGSGDIFWEKPRFKIRCLNSYDEGKTFCFGGDDNNVRLWSPHSDSWKNLQGHTGCVHSLYISKKSDTLISTGSDGTLQIWDRKYGQPRGICHGPQKHMVALAVREDENLAVTSALDGSIHFWDLNNREPIKRIAEPSSPLFCLQKSNDTSFISGGLDGYIREWNFETGQSTESFLAHNQPITALHLRPEKKLLLSGGLDGVIKLWNWETKECLFQTKGHLSSLTKVYISQDGFWGYSASTDCTVKLWAFEWEF